MTGEPLDLGTMAGSAAAEWDALVAAAIVGTDRHPPPAPLPGWDTWARRDDVAVALLDRAAAVVAARRAGVLPSPSLAGVAPAPADDRPPCPPPCVARLQRILGGEHELLLPEWFARCEAIGARLPWVVLPGLLLRGRRQPALDAVVRRLAGPRAAWLAGVMPELGLKAVAASVAPGDELRPPPAPDDSGAMVAMVAGAFDDGAATWAAAPQLRQLVAALDPEWLAPLVRSLTGARFHPQTERTRTELVAMAEFRHELVREFAAAAPAASS